MQHINYEEQLSEHFTVGEMLRSGTAIRLRIKNLPGCDPCQPGLSEQTVISNLQALCTKVLEPLRRQIGKVIVTSGYRCTALNRALEGSEQSQHLSGEAADIYVSGRQMCQKYVNIFQHTDFDQMILEPLDSHLKRWIHISHRRNGENRHQIIGDI